MSAAQALSRRGPQRPGGRGFTLIEVLVAMFIAAIMFALGYSAINQALNSRGSVREHQDHLMALITTVRTLEQDLVQLAPRPVREQLGGGSSYQPALLGSATAQTAMFAPTGGQPVLSLTRGGWNNPSGLQRPGLQRVTYVLDNGTLKREYFYVLDPAQNTQPAKHDLLTRVKSLTLRYMDTSHQWQTQWPPMTSGGAGGADGALRQRPIAIEITLDTEEWGKIVRLLEIAG